MNRNWLPLALQRWLVLYLPGVVSGTTAYDMSGNGNNGTLNNSPTSQRIYGRKW
jgi:hypothetical protein